MITLADELQLDATAFLAPQAVGHTWYPYGFMEPVERNEPFLRSALQLIDSLLVELNGRGVAESAVYLLGFSQGACLSLEYAARSGRRFGGVYALSGGLIGDVLDESIYSSSLSGTPYFLGCSDVDPHIPLERLEQSRTILGSRGAAVELRVYPGMGHTVNEDELDRIRNLAMR
jgi:predicted esterase